jgi:hypothetical protein
MKRLKKIKLIYRIYLVLLLLIVVEGCKTQIKNPSNKVHETSFHTGNGEVELVLNYLNKRYNNRLDSILPSLLEPDAIFNELLKNNLIIDMLSF